MLQHDDDSIPLEESIELNHFLRSKEWFAIDEVLVKTFHEYQNEIEDQVGHDNILSAKYAKGWLDAIRWFRELPIAIHKRGKEQ